MLPLYAIVKGSLHFCGVKTIFSGWAGCIRPVNPLPIHNIPLKGTAWMQGGPFSPRVTLEGLDSRQTLLQCSNSKRVVKLRNAMEIIIENTD